MELRLIVFLSTLLFLSSGFTQTINFNLNSEKEKLIVNILNDACVDSWCEGAVEINFKSVKYDMSSASYIIDAVTVQDDQNLLAHNPISFKCSIEDRSVVYQIINSTNLYDSKTSTAEAKLYQIVDKCVDQVLIPKLTYE